MDAKCSIICVVYCMQIIQRFCLSFCIHGRTNEFCVHHPCTVCTFALLNISVPQPVQKEPLWHPFALHCMQMLLYGHLSSAYSADKWIQHPFWTACIFFSTGHPCFAAIAENTNVQIHFFSTGWMSSSLFPKSIEGRWTLVSVSHSFFAASLSCSTCAIFGSEYCFISFIVESAVLSILLHLLQ